MLVSSSRIVSVSDQPFAGDLASRLSLLGIFLTSVQETLAFFKNYD